LVPVYVAVILIRGDPTPIIIQTQLQSDNFRNRRVRYRTGDECQGTVRSVGEARPQGDHISIHHRVIDIYTTTAAARKGAKERQGSKRRSPDIPSTQHGTVFTTELGGVLQHRRHPSGHRLSISAINRLRYGPRDCQPGHSRLQTTDYTQHQPSNPAIHQPSSFALPPTHQVDPALESPQSADRRRRNRTATARYQESEATTAYCQPHHIVLDSHLTPKARQPSPHRTLDSQKSQILVDPIFVSEDLDFCSPIWISPTAHRRRASVGYHRLTECVCLYTCICDLLLLLYCRHPDRHVAGPSQTHARTIQRRQARRRAQRQGKYAGLLADIAGHIQTDR
jgi:hypothetical protein